MSDRRTNSHADHPAGATVRLTKHHGSGNDFLVSLVQHAGGGFDPSEVAALCDRHRGIGADGLIVGRPGLHGADLQMDLRNADGSFAEMSGNGVRCLVQAAVAAGMVRAGTVNVDTAGGRRAVDYTDMGGGAGFAEVEMGPVSIGPDLALDEPPVSLARPGIVVRACKVNVGNPHIVLLAGEDGEVDVDIDLPTVGPLIEKFVDGGANVEVLRLDPDRDRGRDRGEGPGITDPAGVSSLDIDVWERGVGMTEACGTGACAAAAAAANWGLASATVEVASGGGILVVRLGQGKATLAGPARMVGEVIVELAVLAELVADRDTARAGDETTATVATAAAPAYATAKTATEATRLHVKDVKDVKDAKDVIAAP